MTQNSNKEKNSAASADAALFICGVQFVITDNIGDIFLDQGCVKNRDKPVAVNVADNFVVDIVAFGSSGN